MQRVGHRAWVGVFWMSLALLGIAQVSCDDGEEQAEAVAELEILLIDHPDPVLQGSYLLVESRGEALDGEPLVLQLQVQGERDVVSLNAAAEQVSGYHVFEIGAEATALWSPGLLTVDAILLQGGAYSEPYTFSANHAKELAVFLDTGLTGNYFRNDEVIVTGDGFTAASEGEIVAEVVGGFIPEGGEEIKVSTQLPFNLVERHDRTRGTVRLTTQLGGIEPGQFEGTMTLVSTLKNGSRTRSNASDIELSFGGPEVFGLSPSAPFLGQIVRVMGAGFLGGDAAWASDEATILLFDGVLEDASGATEVFEAKEMAAAYYSGQEVYFGLDVEESEGKLVSSFFGVTAGVFRGTVRPIVLKQSVDSLGEALAIELRLSGTKQVVVVKFLPSFYDSLRHFGLAAAADQVIEQALDRMQGIYSGYQIEFVLEAPDDFLSLSVATLEIGGPDPNGMGLFGYDNTPGKDVGNLRLFDSIGGANAESQEDGYPGYGGVFIDSFMTWSSHTEGVDSGLGGPDPDPLFDEIFDPVRAQPATLAEAKGEGDALRVEEVARGVRTLGNIIGETSAHEVGHSLGLAQPYGALTAYHSAIPGEGCLMDSGSERPFGERAAEPGYAETRFCDDEPQYLGEILGTVEQP